MTDYDTEGNSRWQPVMVKLRNGGRLECQCGALAIIITGNLMSDPPDDTVEGVDYWCQNCYIKAQDAAQESTK